ncbi:hypothetical protein KVP10_08400 [Candidimonas humi]|uniref:Uncharacterized protein n=1 Tax=Candidimonas humi TaxID=683355 RepID=A0ABV8NWP6_9BURK|nr:hypothetical protein [Candidimonas humi]MBV6304906.1 hypothetical protein [Candidimonas humi]
MDLTRYASHTAAMTEDEADDLFADAVQLAHEAFEDATDEHVVGVYARLMFNRRHGLGEDGATMVH